MNVIVCHEVDCCFLSSSWAYPFFLRLHTSAVYFPFCHRDTSASIAFSTFLFFMRRLDDRVVGPLTYPWVCYVASQKSVRFRQLMPCSKLCDGFFSFLSVSVYFDYAGWYHFSLLCRCKSILFTWRLYYYRSLFSLVTHNLNELDILLSGSQTTIHPSIESR
jgi:hypothetical protein